VPAFAHSPVPLCRILTQNLTLCLRCTPQLAYAIKNAGSDRTPFKDFYVGDEYVDQVSHTSAG
jgi:hypothetical protein